MTNKLEKFLWIASLTLLSVIVIATYNHYHKKNFGATVPNTPAQFETSLAVPQGTADTSATLASATLANGSTLSGLVCLTVDANTALAEYECGTPSTTLPTLITGLTRGIDPQYGTSSISSLIYSHRVGADVRITDFPSVQQYANIFNGTQGITNPILYSGVSTTTLQTNNNYLSSVGYVNSVTGEGPATFNTPGNVQLATQSQLQGGVATSSAVTYLVAPSIWFNQTQSATTTVPVTNTSGKLSQAFLDLTQNWTFTGNLTDTNGTTTLIATTTKPLVLDTVPYIFPNTQGSASTILSNNGSGVLSWVTPSSQSFSASSTVSTTTITGTLNLDTTFTPGFTAKTITVYYTLNNSIASQYNQGVAVYNGTNVLENSIFIGQNSPSFSAVNPFSTTTGGGGTITVTLSIINITSTQFTVRVSVVDGGPGGRTGAGTFMVVANQ